MYLTIMGSTAYGVTEDTSDLDIYGYCIPSKSDIFPYLDKVFGFDDVSVFKNYQQHHIFDQDALGGKGREYDFTINNIVRYFRLCRDCNPNMIDSLFVPQSCIIHSTKISEMVRNERHLFLSKEMWPRFKGYAFSQLHKSKGKKPQKGSKRDKLRERYGYDNKFLYHVVRLLSEAEYILLHNDLDLQEKGRREHMKAIRRGEVSEEDIRKWASEKEIQLEKLYHSSTLPLTPDVNKIRKLLLHCLEEHYGSLEIVATDWAQQVLKEIDEKIQMVRKVLYS